MCVPLERSDLYLGSGSPDLAGELGVGVVMEQEHSAELEKTRRTPGRVQNVPNHQEKLIEVIPAREGLWRLGVGKARDRSSSVPLEAS